MMKKKPRSVDFLPNAKRDLRGIGRYTSREWGREQSNSYVRDIRIACAKLAVNPYLGSASEYVRGGYRKYGVGRHLIYYRHTESYIEVVRILHTSMDARRHLQSL